MAISYDENSIHVYRGGGSATRKKVVYTSPGIIRLSAFWDKYLPAAATITSTWSTVNPENDNRVSFASSAVSGQGVETYCTAVEDLDPFEVTIKNKVVASTGETQSISWKVYISE